MRAQRCFGRARRRPHQFQHAERTGRLTWLQAARARAGVVAGRRVLSLYAALSVTGVRETDAPLALLLVAPFARAVWVVGCRLACRDTFSSTPTDVRVTISAVPPA